MGSAGCVVHVDVHKEGGCNLIATKHGQIIMVCLVCRSMLWSA